MNIEMISKGRGFLRYSGILMIILGFAALIYPSLFTLSVVYLVASLFLFSGSFSLVASFAIRGSGSFFGSLLVSLLQLIFGAILWTKPMLGAWVMTVMIATAFFFEGAVQLAFAFRLRPIRGWGWMAASALVGIFAGCAVLVAMPVASVWVVGFIFGVNFLSTGLSALMLSSVINEAGS